MVYVLAVSAAIKANVTQASARIATLQTAMAQVWDSLGPEAIASLDISPFDFDDYLANLQIAKVWSSCSCSCTCSRRCDICGPPHCNCARLVCRLEK